MSVLSAHIKIHEVILTLPFWPTKNPLPSTLKKGSNPVGADYGTLKRLPRSVLGQSSFSPVHRLNDHGFNASLIAN